MVHTLENSKLCISVREQGAELCSLIDKNTASELLWQPDTAVWTGQSPILFPIIGRLWKDTYHLDGKPYHLSKHGFARNSRFSCTASKDTLTFRLHDSDETRTGYPFCFQLLAAFQLIDNRLEITYTVSNTDQKPLYFSIGGHPGFQCQKGDLIRFEKKERLVAERMNQDGYMTGETEIISEDGVIILEDGLFQKDALMFAGLRSHTVTLQKQNSQPDIQVAFQKAPFLGIWAKPGAPYVCLEPWTGINDSLHWIGDLPYKRGITMLPAGESFSFPYTITVLSK